jgi:aldose sugar dehydrogenase
MQSFALGRASSAATLACVFALTSELTLAAPPTYVTAGDVPVQPGARRTTVLENLEHPWSMTWLPDGAMLITERPGRLRIVRDGVLQPSPVAGVPAVWAIGQGGLLDVALHPKFAEEPWVYLTYSVGTPDANRLRVARARWAGHELRDLTVIFEVAQTKSGGAHFGSRLAWLPDGTLLVSVGDGGNPPIKLGEGFIRGQAQNRAAHFGKILRLNADGSIPSDNPFVGVTGADPAVWSYGHRNAQGLVVDSSGAVWATEHGALGGDELNRIVRGANYGWPLVTHSREYLGPAISNARSRKGLSDPVLVWNTATAPSGLMVYTGDKFAAWRGNVFSGGLMTQDVRRIELGADGGVVSQSALRVGQRVRDVRQGPDGNIYVLTDEKAGKLIRFEPAN